MALSATHDHICGLYYLSSVQPQHPPSRMYLAPITLSIHTDIVWTTSRTRVAQKFINPSNEQGIRQLRYTFPLAGGFTVVDFSYTIGENRTVQGIVKEGADPVNTSVEAFQRGETADLSEQLPRANELFTTTVDDFPAGAEVNVSITYIGKLKRDSQDKGDFLFTIPTTVAPRFASYPGNALIDRHFRLAQSGTEITTNLELPRGSRFGYVESPSHPREIVLERNKVAPESASVKLSLPTAELDRNFVLQMNIVPAARNKPTALLEIHPTIPNQYAIMATLVPYMHQPRAAKSKEIVLVCDRSNSMKNGDKINDLLAGVRLLLKSLSVGMWFNICSFSSRHEFLFPEGSRPYDAAGLNQAWAYVEQIRAGSGNAKMEEPLEEAFKKRRPDMQLNVLLLTGGKVSPSRSLIDMVEQSVSESNGSIRVFTLGCGDNVSHALIDGVARAGNGYSQLARSGDKIYRAAARMLKAALTAYVKEFTMNVDYGDGRVEKVMDSLLVDSEVPEDKHKNPRVLLVDASNAPRADRDMAGGSSSSGGHTSSGGRSAKDSHTIPPVSAPQLLQAPWAIPPVSTLRHTTVYLLLSPKPIQDLPKSVALRATSAQGVLPQISIPITVLPQKGETVHQLAARKAVRHLEEGCGWIYHARDARTSSLLRDKFHYCFASMVKREAARLGVTFKVAGKWCHFEAVQEPGLQPEGAVAIDQGELLRGPGSGDLKQSSRTVRYAPESDESDGDEEERAASILAQTRRQDTSATADCIYVADARIPTPVSPPAANPPTRAAGDPFRNPFDTIVTLQWFDGHWKWSGALFQVLRDVDPEMEEFKVLAKASDLVKSHHLPDVREPRCDMLTTALVVALLEHRMPGRKEEWGLLVQKAIRWMGDTLVAMRNDQGIDTPVTEADVNVRLLLGKSFFWEFPEAMDASGSSLGLFSSELSLRHRHVPETPPPARYIPANFSSYDP
ncbi:von Willebrand factor type A domain-containing protein [Diplogelasinospora grovesii]|uniref:von Willebrand factor type A domain-containing protein n=1 Tax=Diplogelasinospora grovesii TaxID=303347 RepID=A0AAN6N2N5_9PEZI|nr:von Willebrand factor type A domain-containing protein [Diplogelasinospora grovesii]